MTNSKPPSAITIVELEDKKEEIVSGDIFEVGARANILRVENRENITGISEDIPDKYLRQVDKK